MNKEFKKITQGEVTRYVLESASGGGTSAGGVASVSMPIGGTRKRGDNLIAQEGDKIIVPVTQKPRLGPLKPQTGGGAHRDKKKEKKQGQEKHKKPYFEDHEIQMASSELQSIAKDAVNLISLVRRYSEKDGIDAWQQSKITKAADYLNAVLQSISGEQGMAEGLKQTLRKFDPTIKARIRQKSQDQTNQGLDTIQHLADLDLTSDDMVSRAMKPNTYFRNAERYAKLANKGVAEGSAHGYNVVRYYEKTSNLKKLTNWLCKEAGLEKNAPVYFDDVDLVYGDKTIVPGALVNPKLKFNDLLTALVRATGGQGKQNVDGVYREQDMAEAPIEMDPAEPMNPMIHGHQGANPAKLQYRMMRGAAQLKDLAQRAEQGSAIGWETIARQFDELAMNVEQIKHALEELAAKRKKGGIGSRGIDPNIGEDHSSVTGGRGQGGYDTYSNTRHGRGVAEVSDATKDSYKEKATQQVKDLKPHAKKGEYKDIAKNMIARREKGLARVSEDEYMMELAGKLAEKISANAPTDVWVKDFQKANPNKYHQFKNKTPAKKAQMAVAASYAAKNPSKKK